MAPEMKTTRKILKILSLFLTYLSLRLLQKKRIRKQKNNLYLIDFKKKNIEFNFLKSQYM